MKAWLTFSCSAAVSSLLLSACGSIVPATEAPQVGSVRTWIDAPLDGSTIPLAPYEVVMHAYDASGVSELELSANGGLLAALPNPDAEMHLATLRYVWSPPAPGNYTLSARAKSGNGLAGSEARALVTVLGEPATPPASFTPTPVVSFTPTLIPSFTPTPVPAELAFTPELSASEFFYGSCGSSQVTIQVHATGPNLGGVLLFLNLQDQSSGEATGWDGGNPMTPLGDGSFTRTVNSSSLAGAESMSQAWLLYQFIAVAGVPGMPGDSGGPLFTESGQVIGRSPVYSDIALTSCGPVFQRVLSPTPVPGIFGPIRQLPSSTPIPLPK